MNIKYDFHIHTGLSPCALEEMSPNNIVNMARLNGLDAIAITDHNSSGNVQAVMSVAEPFDLIVIPGIEVETREEIHVICLFEGVKECQYMQAYINKHLPQRKNKPSILGRQILYNIDDDCIGEEERLISFATQLSIDEVIEYTKRQGGVAIPAHIDRPSYSLVSNLGFVPPDLSFQCLEISQYAEESVYRKKYANYKILQSSDAHELGFIGICNQYLEIPVHGKKRVPKDILDFLKTNQNR